MGVEFMLVNDDTRETYDLGKFTGNWGRLIASRDEDPSRVERGNHFVVDQDVDGIVARLEEDWREDDVETRPGYLRLVAEDIVRWAGTSLVRLSSDSSHDGWHNRDGSWDEGRETGSRYLSEHPEWMAEGEDEERAR
jgi:hypothetical protein